MASASLKRGRLEGVLKIFVQQKLALFAVFCKVAKSQGWVCVRAFSTTDGIVNIVMCRVFCLNYPEAASLLCKF